MLKKMLLMALAGALLLGGQALAKTNHTGRVTNLTVHSVPLGTYDVNNPAYAFISMDPELPAACGSIHKRIAISHDHPLFATVVASLLAAQSKDREVIVAYNEVCTMVSNAWDFAILAVTSSE